MPLAARVSDLHSCPACQGVVPHVGCGVAMGSGSVLIEGKSAARLGDLAACVGPLDAIVTGSKSVVIGGALAARLGDATAHGGSITGGAASVMIGGSLSAPAMPPASVVAGVSSLSARALSHIPAKIVAILSALERLKYGESAVLTGMLGALLGELAIEKISDWFGKGIAKLGEWIPGRIGEFLQSYHELFAEAAWIVLHTVKIKGRTPAERAQWYFQNVLDGLFVDCHGWFSCPLPEVSPEFEFAVPPPAQHKPFEPDADGRPVPFDVSLTHAALLDRFAPIVFEYGDELRGLAIDDLLPRTRLELFDGTTANPRTAQEWLAVIRGLPPRADSEDKKKYGTLHIEAPLSTHQNPRLEATMYGRVLWHGEPDCYELQFMFLRGGSYMPTKYLVPSAWEHEGDGEKASFWVQVTNGVARITRTESGGHKKSVKCEGALYEPRDDPERRPCLFIGHGTHSIATEPGPRTLGYLIVDWFPERESARQVPYVLVHDNNTPIPDLVRVAIFQDHVTWGEGGYGGHRSHERP